MTLRLSQLTEFTLEFGYGRSDSGCKSEGERRCAGQGACGGTRGAEGMRDGGEPENAAFREGR